MKSNTIRILGSLVVCLLLSACSRPKPETMSATIVEANVIQPGSNNDFRQNVGDSVYFAFDKAHLSDEAKATLAKQVEWLQKYPQYEVQIVGHCDERGTVAYNMALGQRRAEAARKFLIAHGIQKSRIVASSLGKEFPISTENTEEGYAKNRVSISLLAMGGKLVEKPANEMQTLGIVKNDGGVIQPENLSSSDEIVVPAAS